MRSFTLFSLLVLFYLFMTPSCKKDENGDQNNPFIILAPPNPLNWALDLPYEDPGAEAFDVTETGDTINITDRMQVTDNIDISQVGTYSVFYNVSDEAGNQADQQVREVRVVLTK